MYQETREALRANDPLKISRSWANSRFIYGADSKQRSENPEYHPLICQTEDGRYVDVEGRPLPLSSIPQYIRDEGKPPKETAPAARREISLADAAVEANTRNASADAPAESPKPRAKRSARKK
jgi:hypothetical protein